MIGLGPEIHYLEIPILRASNMEDVEQQVGEAVDDYMGKLAEHPSYDIEVSYDVARKIQIGGDLGYSGKADVTICVG